MLKELNKKFNGKKILKTIYNLTVDASEATVSTLSKALTLNSNDLKKELEELLELGDIRIVDKRIYLTPAGLKKARKHVKKHRLIERFLTDILKVDTKKVHADAEKIDELFIDEIIPEIDKYLGEPATCPDDIKRIPREKSLKTLDVFPMGLSGIIVGLRGNEKTLKRLNELGLLPGTPLKVIHRAPGKGPVEILIRNFRLALGITIAKNIYIEVKE